MKAIVKGKSLSRTAGMGKAKAVAQSASLALPILYSIALFVSASLLFWVQPLVAKMTLPFLGGTPAVWNTCMLFFQLLLLGGYAYAHVSSRNFSTKVQIAVHMSLLGLSCLFLPMAISKGFLADSSLNPVFRMLALLTCYVGLPFFTLSASAPLMQHWFSKTGHAAAHDPYFLYGASNFGSALALLAFPTILEPNLYLASQSYVWAGGFGLLVVLFAVCAYLLPKNTVSLSAKAEAEDDSAVPSIGERATWVGLAFVPSSLMLGVTTYFSTDIAALPLLWTVPLTLYLFSFIIVFSRVPAVVHKVTTFAVPFGLALVLFLLFSGAAKSVGTAVTLHLTVFFIVAIAFHGELASRRPSPKYLSGFFLYMSLGGALGGIFNGFLAPLLFSTVAEYPFTLTAAAVLLLTFAANRASSEGRTKQITVAAISAVVIGALSYWLLRSWPLMKVNFDSMAQEYRLSGPQLASIFSYLIPATLCLIPLFIRKNVTAFAAALGVYVIIGHGTQAVQREILHLERSFFGVLKVENNSWSGFRSLVNGTTLHGKQNLDPAKAQNALTYYHETGPVGQLFREFSGDKMKKHVGLVGLGTGTLASYGQTGQDMTFYEIDAKVRRIAETYFTFLANCKAKVNFEMGDARLRLERAPENYYGILVIDAFSSDAIPVHLLTLDAVKLYFSKLEKDGVLAVHVSNRYLSLEPVVGRIAAEAGLIARVRNDPSDDASGKTASTWIILAKEDAHFGSLAKSDQWHILDGFTWNPVWTDDYSNLMSILRW